MSTFSTPTINDFLSQIYVRSESIADEFGRRKAELDADCAKRGMLQSSSRVLLLPDLIDEYTKKGVSILLGELRRALQYPELDPLELRNLIGPRLEKFVAGIISSAKLEKASEALRNNQAHELIRERTQKARQNVLFWLRQFDIGWDVPVEPESLRPPPTQD